MDGHDEFIATVAGQGLGEGAALAKLDLCFSPISWVEFNFFALREHDKCQLVRWWCPLPVRGCVTRARARAVWLTILAPRFEKGHGTTANE